MIALNRKLLLSFAALGLLFAARPVRAAEPTGLDHWQSKHPNASPSLGEWVKRYPDPAKLFFDWAGQHNDHAKEFVLWTTRNPRKPLENFIQHHPHMDYFQQMTKDNRPAFDAFMGWCRRYPEAANAIMTHTEGMQWISKHMSEAVFRLQHPKRG